MEERFYAYICQQRHKEKQVTSNPMTYFIDKNPKCQHFNQYYN